MTKCRHLCDILDVLKSNIKSDLPKCRILCDMTKCRIESDKILGLLFSTFDVTKCRITFTSGSRQRCRLGSESLGWSTK